jgi:hypothetical protein
MIVMSDQWIGSKDSLKWRANETPSLGVAWYKPGDAGDVHKLAARILQEQGRTSVIWPESQLCVGFGVTSQMPGRGGELANVLQDLELKKCFHQFLRGNAEAFDGPVEGGPCRPVPRAGERKQPFQYALAQSRDLLQVENIVVIENSSRQVAGTSGEKEQVISVAIHGHDPSCR